MIADRFSLFLPVGWGKVSQQLAFVQLHDTAQEIPGICPYELLISGSGLFSYCSSVSSFPRNWGPLDVSWAPPQSQSNALYCFWGSRWRHREVMLGWGSVADFESHSEGRIVWSLLSGIASPPLQAGTPLRAGWYNYNPQEQYCHIFIISSDVIK